MADTFAPDDYDDYMATPQAGDEHIERQRLACLVAEITTTTGKQTR